MKKLNIVLYNPEIPQNTGNISRTCAVTGAALHIIRPTGFEISDRTLKRAGLDYWDKLEVFYYESEDDFFEKNPGCSFYCFTTKAPRCYTEVTYETPVFLFFGKENGRLSVFHTAGKESVGILVPVFKAEFPKKNQGRDICGSGVSDRHTRSFRWERIVWWMASLDRIVSPS